MSSIFDEVINLRENVIRIFREEDRNNIDALLMKII